MLSLQSIASDSGARKKSKRLCRGNGSGKGTYGWRGLNGQNSRAGGGVAPWFEWGQTPLFRRLPKLKGFSNAVFKKHYSVVNVGQLEVLAQSWVTEINKEVLLERRIIRNKTNPVKILGEWSLLTKVNVKADRISKVAQEKIEKAGGKIL